MLRAAGAGKLGTLGIMTRTGEHPVPFSYLHELLHDTRTSGSTLTEKQLPGGPTGLSPPAVYPGVEPGICFFIIRGANHANLYKNLIKIQMFNINLGTIGGRPLPAPLSSPLL